MVPQKALRDIFFNILDAIAATGTANDISMHQDIKNLLPAGKSDGMTIINNNYQTLTITNIIGLVAEGLKTVEKLNISEDAQKVIDIESDPAKTLIEYVYENDLSWHDAKKIFQDKYLRYVHERHPRNEEFANKLRVSSSQATALRKSIGAMPRRYALKEG